jgi:hypothetical protein
MSTTTPVSPKGIPIRLVFLTGLMIILAIVVTTGFIWIHTAHVITPAVLNLIDNLWTLFICRCPPL